MSSFKSRTPAGLNSSNAYHSATPTRAIPVIRALVSPSKFESPQYPAPCCTIGGIPQHPVNHSTAKGVFAVFCDDERGRLIEDQRLDIARLEEKIMQEKIVSQKELADILHQRNSERDRCQTLLARLDELTQAAETDKKTFAAVRLNLESQLKEEILRAQRLGDEVLSTKTKLDEALSQNHALDAKVLSLLHQCDQHTTTIALKQKEVESLRIEVRDGLAEIHKLKAIHKGQEEEIAKLRVEVSTQKSLNHGLNLQLEEAKEKLDSVFLFRQTMHEVQQKWKMRRKAMQTMDAVSGSGLKAIKGKAKDPLLLHPVPSTQSSSMLTWKNE